MIIKPPVFHFEDLVPVTITAIADYRADELNFHAIAGMLITTNRELDPDVEYEKKQGKIILPKDYIEDGVITTVIDGTDVRGIRLKEQSKSFPNSIIIDIGANGRKVNVAFSKPTIEVRGATSREMIEFVIDCIFDQVRAAQASLDNYRKNREIDEFLERRIENCKTEEEKDELLGFLGVFDGDLYRGELKVYNITFEMTNILFDLGFYVNLERMGRLMNEAPFSCKFTNGTKSSPTLIIHYNYNKTTRNKENRDGKHTIRVFKTGHVKYSGQDPEDMKKVYYTLLKRILLNLEDITSYNRDARSVKMKGGKNLSKAEFREILLREEELRLNLINGDIETF